MRCRSLAVLVAFWGPAVAAFAQTEQVPTSSPSQTVIIQGPTGTPQGQPVTPTAPPPQVQTAPLPGQPAKPPPAQTQESYSNSPPPGQPSTQTDTPANRPLPEITPIAEPEEVPKDSGATLDGHVREGAFLSSPGSLTFILHNTFLLSAGGMMTQVVAKSFDFNSAGARQAMLAGLLIGAGLGFGASAWWQFNHWMGAPVANFAIVNSVLGGMFWAGLLDLISSDKTLLTWGAVLGAGVATWLTAIIGGGEMSVATGTLMTSGASWFAIYTALLLGVVATTGNSTNLKAGFDALLITPGVGAVLMALAGLKFNPTTTQILRADLFGVGAGAAALLISALFLGRFDNPTPYVMAMVASAGAIATVSLLWEESAARPNAMYRDPERHKPYRNVWW
ncbi:MAG: hypothetical protein ACT4TC_17285 [Myxococcaceae bacterium]